jgi:glycosyltransferase involved in cell wall biosynthesis
MSSQAMVSVIVTTFNSASFVEPCFKAVQRQSYPHIELVVVDNNSSDSTRELAARYTSKVIRNFNRRGTQKNTGARESSGQYIFFVDSDMELSRNVVKACVETMEANPVLKALVVPEQSFGEGFWAQCKVLERSYYIGVDWMEAARFFSREGFESVGGFDEHIRFGEDIDLPARIRDKHGPESIGRVNELIYHNERRMRFWNNLQKKFYYATQMRAYLSKAQNRANFRKQASLVQRPLLFFKRPRDIVGHPLVWSGMMFQKGCEFAAGLLGYGYELIYRKPYKAD